jgi:hypothetical protein
MNHKRILMVALEFPPCHSAGVQRPLSFVRHLPRWGWQPIVLTAKPKAYRNLDGDGMPELPPGVEVARAFALDSSRHLAIGGRYLSITASPDRYVTWFLPALMRGLRLIRQYRPHAIWSTYPVATSHWIAGVLAAKSGLPWVADFRDPAQFHYDEGAVRSSRARQIDAAVARKAEMLVFTTEKARGLYLEKYPALSPEHTAVIENGYDGAAFSQFVENAGEPAGHEADPVVLLHSGALYGEGRDPTALIEAAGILGPRLAAEGRRIILRFRGASASPAQRELVHRFGAEPYVEFAPRVSFEEAQGEMGTADVLVLIQAPLFDLQIPGKVYEYIASRRPIVALTGQNGATAQLLREVDAAMVVGDRDVTGIVDGLATALAMGPRGGDLKRYDRAAGAERLAGMLNRIAATRGSETREAAG